MFYDLFQKFQMRHEGFSFYGLGESDEGADTDLIYNFCWFYPHRYLKQTPSLKLHIFSARQAVYHVSSKQVCVMLTKTSRGSFCHIIIKRLFNNNV